MDNCVTIVQGNDFTLNITLSILNEETQVPEAYDLTDARLIEIKLISQISGHTLRLAPYKLTEKNVLSALVSGNKLKLTDYDVEVSFVKNGLNKRAYECNVIRVVRCNGDTDYSTVTDGESGYGIDISIKADVEQVYLGKNTGGGGGTTDYNDLENKPSINDVTLEGNQTSEDLHLMGEETGRVMQGAIEANQAEIEANVLRDFNLDYNNDFTI